MQMHHFAAAAVLALGAASVIAQAADLEACPGPKLAEVKSVAMLAPDLRAQLGSDRADHTGIADRGEKFNATDVILDETPKRRFVLAGVSDKCAVVAIERGGRGYFVEMRVFAYAGSAWKELRRKALREVPNSVQELVAYAGK